MDENGRKLTCKQSVIKVINQMNAEQRNESKSKSTSTLYETGNEQVAGDDDKEAPRNNCCESEMCYDCMVCLDFSVSSIEKDKSKFD